MPKRPTGRMRKRPAGSMRKKPAYRWAASNRRPCKRRSLYPYRIVEASAFTFAVPNDWQVEEGYFQDIFSFKFNGERIGEAEILGWFDAETWNNFKPNHSEQTDFREYSDLLVMDDTDVRVYKIQLTHTKPAAAQDPDWKYEETRWYVSVKENERSYGFYFDSEKIDEKVMETVVSSFRLKSVNRSTQE